MHDYRHTSSKNIKMGIIGNINTTVRSSGSDSGFHLLSIRQSAAATVSKWYPSLNKGYHREVSKVHAIPTEQKHRTGPTHQNRGYSPGELLENKTRQRYGQISRSCYEYSNNTTKRNRIIPRHNHNPIHWFIYNLRNRQWQPNISITDKNKTSSSEHEHLLLYPFMRFRIH